MQVWINDFVDKPANVPAYEIKSKEDNSYIKFIRGEKLAAVHDHGDGILLTVGTETLTLEYYEEEAILALLLARYEGKMKLVKTKTIKEI